MATQARGPGQSKAGKAGKAGETGPGQNKQRLSKPGKPAKRKQSDHVIDHPQGGSTARPSFGAVPQRAVDIIWGCAVLCVLCCVCCAVSAALYVCIRGACGACVCAFAG